MESTRAFDYIIVGAGIAGLSFAYRLKETNQENFLIIEKNNYCGGNWLSNKYQESLYELGPNTFINKSKHLSEMISKIGFQGELLSKTFKQSKRYFYFGEDSPKLVAVSPWSLFQNKLIGLETIVQAIKELFLKSDDSEKSIAEFIKKHFGNEVLKNLIAPALQGIWAGDVNKLSASCALKELMKLEKEHGSIIRGLILKKKNKAHEICSFKNGMQSFTEALADYISRDKILLNTELGEIKYQNNIYELRIGEELLKTKNLIIATKAFEAATLVENLSSGLSRSLNSIEYSPVALVVFSLQKKLFEDPEKLNAFGFLNASSKIKNALGTIFASELFPERNLEDEFIFSSFTGGALNPEIIKKSQEEITNIIFQEHADVFKDWTLKPLRAADFKPIAFKSIRRAIPQYNLGYGELLKNLETELSQYPGLKLIGNYLDGVSLTDTIDDVIASETQ